MEWNGSVPAHANKSAGNDVLALPLVDAHSDGPLMLVSPSVSFWLTDAVDMAGKRDAAFAASVMPNMSTRMTILLPSQENLCMVRICIIPF